MDHNSSQWKLLIVADSFEQKVKMSLKRGHSLGVMRTQSAIVYQMTIMHFKVDSVRVLRRCTKSCGNENIFQEEGTFLDKFESNFKNVPTSPHKE